MQSRAARTARGWILGAFATLAAAVSHGIADGVAPSALALGGGLVFAGVLGTFLVGHRASLPRLVAVVAGSQLAFHLVFSFLTPIATTAGSHHGTPGVLDPVVVHHGTGPAMSIAHAIALLVTIVFLHRAELAVWGLLQRAVAAVTLAGMPVVDAVRSAPRAAAAGALWHPLSVVFRTALRDRGPPVALGA